MPEYKVELVGGNMTIVEARSIKLARKWAQGEYGRVMEPTTSRATDAEVEWVKAMGGIIHEVTS